MARRKPEISTREHILDVAEDLIARYGTEGLQLKEVAEQVGIRPPSVFAHFDGRQGIADAIGERILAQLVRRLGRVLDRYDDPEEAVRQGIGSLVDHLLDNPAHVRLLLRDLARSSQSLDVDLSSPEMSQMFTRIGEVLSEGERRGVFRRVRAVSFLAQVEGAILANIAFSGWDDSGRPRTPVKRGELRREAQAFAFGYLRPSLVDRA